MPEKANRDANVVPAKPEQDKQSLKPAGATRRKKPSPQTEEAELGPEIQHGQLSADELNSRNDV